jgi:CubicO group peptidase (beta-lactamase class C family)
MDSMKHLFMTMFLMAAATLAACGGSGGGGNNQGSRNYSYQVPADIGDGWTIASLNDVGINQGRIEEATKEVLRNNYSGIDSFVIVRNGRLVHDVYFNNFSSTTRHDLRSATKSITSMLIGIAIDQGYIGDASEPALSYLTSYTNILNWDDRKNSIQIRDFLTMSPGLACNDSDRSSPGNEANMYPRSNWVKFVLDLPMINDPGETWSYCTAGVVALGGVIHEATGMLADEFAESNLFGPLGISSYNWEYTTSGQVDTGGHIRMLPRDMAKIGELMLHRGQWGAQQLLSDTWVDLSTSTHFSLDAITDYGYLWWRRDFGAAGAYPAFLADGNGGQNIFVVPAADLVVVFTGSNYNSSLSAQPLEIMEQYIIPALE